MELETLVWSFEIQHHPAGRIAIEAYYRALRAATPTGVLIDQIVCSTFVQGLHRQGRPRVLAVMDGLLCAAARAKELCDRRQIDELWLLCNADEQARFLSRYAPPHLVRFDVSTNTLEQAEKLVARARERGLTEIGVMDYESHVTRTIFTLIKQARKQGAAVRFIPFTYPDTDRPKAIAALRNLAVLTEAVKLWRYRNKGDVASFEEAEHYYEALPPPFAPM
jgi:hypothetical protein